MDNPADFVPVAFDGTFLLTDGKGKVRAAVWHFPGYRPPTDEAVQAALKVILDDPRNTEMRPMTLEEVEMLDAKSETRQ